MNQINIDGYQRINRRKARNLYIEGNTLRLCPCNINPVNFWGMYADVSTFTHTVVDLNGKDNPENRGKEFDRIINHFEAYNCNHETGRYCAYYVREA